MSPSTETCGSQRSSQRGSHQAWRPSSTITAGTSRQRTTVASTATATAMPRPNCLTVTLSLAMNAANTLTMISAAEVITRPVEAIPSTTARRASPWRCHCSWQALSRNTS